MKKTVIALFAALALLLASGALVSGASAAPYPNTVATKSSVQGSSSVKSGKTLSVTIRVKAGNATVKDGTVKVSFGGRTYTAKVKNGVAKFKVKAPKVKKTTKKTLKVTYKPAGSSVYKASSASKTIKIKANKKKRK